MFADSYPVHHSKESSQLAESLNIQLIKIPEGTTDSYQPLDCRVFGAIKARARAEFNKFLTKFVSDHMAQLLADPNYIPEIEYPTIQDSAHNLSTIWEEVSKEMIITAWNKAFEALDLTEYYDNNDTGCPKKNGPPLKKPQNQIF